MRIRTALLAVALVTAPGLAFAQGGSSGGGAGGGAAGAAGGATGTGGDEWRRGRYGAWRGGSRTAGCFLRCWRSGRCGAG